LSAPRIVQVAAIDFCLRPKVWDFATDRAADIEANWQKRLAANPQLYDGKVLLMCDEALGATPTDPKLDGTCFIVDYKLFQAWHDFGRPAEVKNLFASAAVRSADGAYLLGEMAPWTMNAGQIYCPAGTPDLNDLAGDRLDLEGSALRELVEETGLAPPHVTPARGWTIVFDGALIACMKELRSELSAAELLARANTFLSSEKNPELTRLIPVFRAAEISDRMPAFMRAFLRHAFGADQG
jgi:hypothetical protein